VKHLFFLFVLCACQQQTPVAETEPVNGVQKKSDFHTQTFANNDGTYGYLIYKDSTPLIRQAQIPARQGLLGFSDSVSAARVAAFALTKIEAGLFPPTINSSEIDSILNATLYEKKH